MKRFFVSVTLMLLLAVNVFAAAPTVVNVTPASGPDSGGTFVVITGTDFTGTLSVSFGAFPAASFIIDSNTQITCTSPAHAFSSVDITVTNADGTSVTSPADIFTFFEPTATVTKTVTETITETITGTETKTVTETVTQTMTQTVTLTAMETPADTFTVTPAITPTSSGTVSVTDTFTVTNTPAGTATVTMTITDSPTLTPTLTHTLTHTKSETPTFTSTATFTATRTYTPTSSATRTVTETCTAIYTATVTFTLTPYITPAIEDGQYGLLKGVIYPNPVKSGEIIYLLYDVDALTQFKIEIYTIDGRKLMRFQPSLIASGKGRLEMNTCSTSSGCLSPGVYFYMVTEIGYYSGRETKFEVRKLVVVK